jgi:hypothetical protein
VVAIAVVNRVVPDRSGENDFDAFVSVERYLKGNGEEDIFVDDPGPCGSLSPHMLGSRVLFFLYDTGDSYRDLACSASRGLNDSGLEMNPRTIEYLAQVEATIANPGDFPYLPTAIAATLGPLAFLAASAFLFRRSRSA